MDGLHSLDVVPLERFYDCSVDVETATRMADSSLDEESRMKGAILLVGTLILLCLLTASACAPTVMENGTK